MTNDPPNGQGDAQNATIKPRCSEWLDEEHSLSDGQPVFVRCEKRVHLDDVHTHGRFEWGPDGWNEQLTREMTDAIVRLADDIEGGGEG